MNQEIPTWRRLLALTLLGTLPALSTSIPVLDMMGGERRTAMEAEHHPGTHGFPHNHLNCIQQQANQWAPTPATPVGLVAEGLVLLPVPDLTLLIGSTRFSRPNSRSPPSV